VALFLTVGNLGIPSLFLHNFLGPENGIFEVNMAVKVVWILNQMAVLDIPPPITIADFWDVIGGVADGTGYELAKFYGFWHRWPPLDLDAKKATCRGDESPWILGIWIVGSRKNQILSC
jgi:hypothetical protein